MRKTTFLAALVGATLSLPVHAQLVSIPVHNTGVDATNVLVAPGAQASFWTLTAKPAGAVEAIGSNPFRFNCCYFPDTATAAWVSPQAGGSAGVNGVYTYDLVFDLAGLNPGTASIVGTFGTDNSGSLSLNGNAPVVITGSGDFGAPTPFAINSGFVAGLNTIRVQVNNEGDPTAFFVSFTRATAAALVTPVPALSWPALLALALLLAGMGTVLARKTRSLR